MKRKNYNELCAASRQQKRNKIKAYLGKVPLKEVAAMANVSMSALRGIIADMGLDPLAYSKHKKAKQEKINAEMIEFYQEHSMAETKAKFGVSSSTISYVLKKAGLRCKKPTEQRYRKMSAAAKASLHAYIAEHRGEMSDRELAQRLRISRGLLTTLTKAGIVPPPPMAKGNNPAVIDELRRILEGGGTLADAERAIGLTRARLWTIARRNGIDTGYESLITEDMLATIREKFPITRNAKLAAELGISQSTLARTARAEGLKKDPEWLKAVRKELSTKNAPIVAAKLRKYWKGKGIPERLKQYQFMKGGKLPETEEQKKARIEKTRATRNLVIKQERRRISLGLPQRTKLKLKCNTTSELRYIRHDFKKLGYILRPCHDRPNVFYYGPETKRLEFKENSPRCQKNKCEFYPLEDKDTGRDVRKVTRRVESSEAGGFYRQF